MFHPLPFELDLATHWLGHPTYFVSETASTNREIGEWRDARTGTVLLTDYQSAGRGRRGRTWHSPPGSSLLFSMLLPPFPAERVSLLPHISAIAVARAYEHHLRISPVIKWPNDVLLDGRKCGGILLESDWQPDAPARVVAGIGLNVNQRAEEFAHISGGTSLRAVLGREVDRGALFAALLVALERAYDAFAGGWMPHAEWSRRAGVPGLPLWVDTGDGAPWPATARALGAGGELIVKNEDGKTITLHAGDVSVRTVPTEVQR